MHAIEGFDHRADLDVEAGLFLDLAARGVGQRFAEVEQAARQRPLPLRGSCARRDDQRPAVAHHDGADADHRVRGVFSGHMKSHTEYLTFNIRRRMGFENITPKVDAAVRKSGVKEGLVLVNAMHITASVFINDDEHRAAPGLREVAREPLAPFDASPQTLRAQPHRRRQRRRAHEAPDHGPRSRRRDHQRQADFGPWEQIFYGEFDGNAMQAVCR